MLKTRTELAHSDLGAVGAETIRQTLLGQGVASVPSVRTINRILARRGEGLFAALLRLGQERDARGASLLAALAWLGEDYDPDALHRLRIGARRLRYMAELSEGLKGAPAEASALFKDVQERLGQIRDAHVLSVWMGRQAGSARAGGREALAAEASAQHDWFLERSRSHRVSTSAITSDAASRGKSAR